MFFLLQYLAISDHRHRGRLKSRSDHLANGTWSPTCSCDCRTSALGRVSVRFPSPPAKKISRKSTKLTAICILLDTGMIYGPNSRCPLPCGISFVAGKPLVHFSRTGSPIALLSAADPVSFLGYSVLSASLFRIRQARLHDAMRDASCIPLLHANANFPCEEV